MTVTNTAQTDPYFIDFPARVEGIQAAMSQAGVDVFRMATSFGWDIYPIGSAADPERIPKGTLAGLVVVC